MRLTTHLNMNIANVSVEALQIHDDVVDVLKSRCFKVLSWIRLKLDSNCMNTLCKKKHQTNDSFKKTKSFLFLIYI